MTTEEIVRQAQAELDQEAFRSAVEARKVYIRNLKARPWWQRLFPFKLKFERID